MKPLLVRCSNRTVFPVDRNTLEAEGCSWYDAFCFVDPDPLVEYISKQEWEYRRECILKRYEHEIE